VAVRAVLIIALPRRLFRCFGIEAPSCVFFHNQLLNSERRLAPFTKRIRPRVRAILEYDQSQEMLQRLVHLVGSTWFRSFPRHFQQIWASDISNKYKITCKYHDWLHGCRRINQYKTDTLGRMSRVWITWKIRFPT
jgi:hypothetical protein